MMSPWFLIAIEVFTGFPPWLWPQVSHAHRGEYAAENGQPHCTLCPAGRTTNFEANTGLRRLYWAVLTNILGKSPGKSSVGFKIHSFFGLKQRVSTSCFPLIYPEKTSPSFGKCRSRRAPRKKNSAVATEISSREGACSAKVAHVPWPRRIYATPNLPMKPLAIIGMWKLKYHKMMLANNLFCLIKMDLVIKKLGQDLVSNRWSSPIPKHSQGWSVVLCIHAHDSQKWNHPLALSWSSQFELGNSPS